MISISTLGGIGLGTGIEPRIGAGQPTIGGAGATSTDGPVSLSPAVQSLLGPTTAASIAAASSQTPADLSGLTQVSPVAVQDFGIASAQDILAAGERAAGGLLAEGATAEAAAYGNAQAIANQNARLALVSGNIQTVQQQRLLRQTVGGQRADIAGAGLQQAGNAAFLLRDSLRQGMLEAQLIGTQARITSGGYEQQSAAAGIEAATAKMASDVAINTAATESAAATQLAQNARAAGAIAQAQGVNSGMQLAAQQGPGAATGGFRVAGGTGSKTDQFIWGPPTPRDPGPAPDYLATTATTDAKASEPKFVTTGAGGGSGEPFAGTDPEGTVALGGTDPTRE